MKSTLRLYEHRCLRCRPEAHVWVSRLEHPRQCPRCKSARWSEARVERKAKAVELETVITGIVGEGETAS